LSLAVAGQAMTTRMTTGTMVQITSAVVLWLNWAASLLRERRHRNIAQPLAPNPRTPMTTQTHSTHMGASQAIREVWVTPQVLVSRQATGWGGSEHGRPAG